jgi:predicted PurR-regulated permease PerM
MSQTSSGSSAAGRASLAVWLQPAAWVVVLVLVVVFFNEAATVALGILAATIIACTVAPLLRYIPAPRSIGAAVVGLVVLAALGLVAFSLYLPLRAPVADAIEKWPRTKIELDATLANWSEKLGLGQELTVDRIVRGLLEFLVGRGGEAIFSRSADVLLGLSLSLTFAVIGSIFLLAEPPERLTSPLLRMMSSANRPKALAVLEDLGPRFRRWALGTITGMFVVFCAASLGFTLVGVKFAIPLALLAGFAEIVPVVGPATACAVATLFALAAQGPGQAAGVLVVYAIVEGIEAYLILPLIMRGAVNVHPAVTLFSVVLWGKVFGVPGLMLAIPVNLVIATLLEHFRIRPREMAEQATG